MSPGDDPDRRRGFPVSVKTPGRGTMDGVQSTPMVRVLVGVVLAGVALAACGSGEDQGARNTIPGVENPRDVQAVADRPCDLLSPQQAAGFGIDRPPRQVRGPAGTVDCEWRSSRSDVWVYISVSVDKPILEEVYDQRGKLAYFELTEVGDYPAIVSRTDANLPVCDIDIKLAERQSVTVSYDSTTFNNLPKQGCVVGRQVAREVLGNVPPTG